MGKDGDKVTVKSDEGNVTILTEENAKKLPKDFPQDIPYDRDEPFVGG